MVDVTVKEAAEILDFDPRWVRTLLKTEKIPGGHRNGRKWLIPEEGIQRYRSGKSGGRAIALKQDQEVEIPENLLTTLMSEQARESMSRHSKDLHSEAGRWLEKVRAFHEGDLGFDYLLANLDFVESQSEDWLTTIFFHSHLKEDQPTTFEKFGQWFKEARAFKEKVVGLHMEWREVVLRRLKKEKTLFEGEIDNSTESNVDINDAYFALTIWCAILRDHSSGHPFFLSQEEWLGSVYEIQNKGDSQTLWYLSQCIASGTEAWVNRARILHHLFYEDLRYLLPEKIQCSGLFEEQIKIKAFAADTSRCLDLICRGAVIFTPGNCKFCTQLLF